MCGLKQGGPGLPRTVPVHEKLILGKESLGIELGCMSQDILGCLCWVDSKDPSVPGLSCPGMALGCPHWVHSKIPVSQV